MCTVNEIASKYELSPVMISRWKAEFISRASTVFEKGTSESDKLKKEYESKQEHLEQLFGKLTVETLAEKNLVSNESLGARKAMARSASSDRRHYLRSIERALSSCSGRIA